MSEHKNMKLRTARVSIAAMVFALAAMLAFAAVAFAEGETATPAETPASEDTTTVASATPADATAAPVAQESAQVSGKLVSKVTYSHYDLNKKKWVKDSSSAFAYDASGNAIKLGTEKVTYKFNADGSKKSSTRVLEGGQYKIGPYYYDKKGRVVKAGKKGAKYYYSKQGYVKRIKTYSTSKKKWETSKITYKYYKNGLAKKSTTYNAFNHKKERVTVYNAQGLPTKVTMYDFNGGKSKASTVTTYKYTMAANGLPKNCTMKRVFKKNKKFAPYQSKVTFKYAKIVIGKGRFARMMNDVLDSSRIELAVIQWF